MKSILNLVVLISLGFMFSSCEKNEVASTVEESTIAQRPNWPCAGDGDTYTIKGTRTITRPNYVRCLSDSQSKCYECVCCAPLTPTPPVVYELTAQYGQVPQLILQYDGSTDTVIVSSN